MLTCVPCTASALQLHWSSGADTLTFTEATRCTLVVQADPAEQRLPPEWRLLWVADTSGIELIALDPGIACSGDAAQVADIELPTTPADSAANLITAHFCSGGTTAASRAEYLVDLPGWARGKLKVVALDPSDSSTVIESNEVTFNGGVSDPYPFVILHATSIHQSLQLQVTAVGSGLNAASSMSIMAPDSS
jgi:hypothetical protein